MTDNLLSHEIIHKLDDRTVEEHLRSHYRDIFALYQAIFVDAGTGQMNIRNLTSYANNAAAVAGGLSVGDLYRLGDTVGVVH